MSFKNLFIKHDRSEEEQAWLQEEIEDQEVRFKAIEDAMDEIEPTRARWYKDFFDRITTLGFNVDGDDKVLISPDQIPVQPEGRKDQVVWKYGVDTEE